MDDFVSILTVTKRDGWQQRAVEQVKKQKLQNFIWVIVHENNFSGIEPDGLPVLLVGAPKKTRISNLNASLNEGLRHCSGKYVIFYQDFIDLPQNCFKKLIHQASERHFVTTLTCDLDGNPDGRYSGSNDCVWCEPSMWESNVAIAPLSVIRRLGGFDEDYDNGWSWDNVNIAERAAMLGCRFRIDETNRTRLIPHRKEPDINPSMPLNGDLHARKMDAVWSGEAPICLDFIK